MERHEHELQMAAIMAAIYQLENAAGDDGYVIYKQGVGYTVKLRAAVGHSLELGVAIRCAILADHKQATDLDKELADEVS